LRRNLDKHFDDALTHGYRPLIAEMRNHPKDRHVAACAVAGEASLIVTFNVKDFALLPDGITAVTPDDFLLRLMGETPDLLRTALESRWMWPPSSVCSTWLPRNLSPHGWPPPGIDGDVGSLSH
jgi:hypothetical protein